MNINLRTLLSGSLFMILMTITIPAISMEMTEEQLKLNNALILAELAKKEERKNEILVPLWGSNSITADSNSNNVKNTIATYALGDTYATALYVRGNSKQIRSHDTFPSFI